MKAVVSEKGQVTIPKPLRERLGIRAGQVLEFRYDHGELVAKKQASEDAVAKVTGIIKLDRPVDRIVDEMRGPRPKP